MAAWLLVRATCIGVAALALTLLTAAYGLTIVHILGLLFAHASPSLSAAAAGGAAANDGGDAYAGSDVLAHLSLLASQLSSPSALQYLTMSNVAMQMLFVVLFVLLVCVDDALVAVRERVRERGKLPSHDVIDHHNHRSYDVALQQLSTVRSTRRSVLAVVR